MVAMLTAAALSLVKTLERFATPYSVKAWGNV
jgi:hypothetical protein